MSSSRKTLVLLLTILSLGLRATVSYPAGLEELKARQCCARHCPRRSSTTPHRCRCCSQLASDEQLGLTPRVILAVNDGPMVFTARDEQPHSVAVARLVEVVDFRAFGPPLFLRTHHIQR